MERCGIRKMRVVAGRWKSSRGEKTAWERGGVQGSDQEEEKFAWNRDGGGGRWDGGGCGIAMLIMMIPYLGSA
eukprot:7719586-Pyramimonas_sp.AAC.1